MWGKNLIDYKSEIKNVKIMFYLFSNTNWQEHENYVINSPEVHFVYNYKMYFLNTTTINDNKSTCFSDSKIKVYLFLV